MKPGRKTSFQERIEIAQYTITNEYDYHGAAEKYQVFINKCIVGFKSMRRMKNKCRVKPLTTKPNLTEEKKLQPRIKELEHRNQYLESGEWFIKKG